MNCFSAIMELMILGTGEKDVRILKRTDYRYFTKLYCR